MYVVSLSLIASLLAACTNLFLRKNTSTGENGTCRYLFFYYFSSLIFSLPLSYEVWTTPFNLTVFSLGSIVGACNAMLLVLAARALLHGPAGITFAFQNAAYIFPGIVLFLLFGEEYGFSFSLYQLAGMLFVILGLVLGASRQSGNKMAISRSWLQYALACFGMQVIALSVMQGRSALFSTHAEHSGLISWTIATSDDVWFMPAQFAASLLFAGIALLKEKRTPNIKEMTYGTLGGLLNSIVTFLLLITTKIALPFEQAIIFPCFAVGVIFVCNFWAKWLYQEHFDVRANSCAALGVAVGSIVP